MSENEEENSENKNPDSKERRKKIPHKISLFTPLRLSYHKIPQN